MIDIPITRMSVILPDNDIELRADNRNYYVYVDQIMMTIYYITRHRCIILIYYYNIR